MDGTKEEQRSPSPVMLTRRMSYPGFSAAAALLLLLIVSVVPIVPCEAKWPNHHLCTFSSSCGNITDIRYPFRLKEDPRRCGSMKYELACEYNHTYLYLHSGKFIVEEINYDISTIRILDPQLQKVYDWSSLSLHSLAHENFTTKHSTAYLLSKENLPLNLIDCEGRINSSRYVDTAPCRRNSSSLQTYSYVVVGGMQFSDLEDSCRINLVVYVSTRGKNIDNTSCSGIHDWLLYGTDLQWSYKGFRYDFAYVTEHVYRLFVVEGSILLGLFFFIGCILPVRILLVCPWIIIVMICEWRRRKSSVYHLIQQFIGPQNNLTPIRYSYSNLRKMTKGFKQKLGEGSYGSVYKGKLRSGRLVAVKVLSGSRADGQDFINEVATIGRIHHVNVVRLIGFSVQGSKRALVYDFMPNGSLDKYIFPEKEENISLSLEKIYEISLGIAHGVEYLHRGCDAQILHFDIKPHNILLDKDFIPKISDFGLAKLYPVDKSIVSLTAARGTRGYMAPELFYKNIGGVSYKADVYSFGMMLMEMAGRRRNLNVFAEHSSQIYFPTWIYDKFSEGQEIELMEDATEGEKELLRRLIIVALWCIQLTPNDRPSMHKVVEMLEANAELLQMPPRPLLTPRVAPVQVQVDNRNPTDMSINIG